MDKSQKGLFFLETMKLKILQLISQLIILVYILLQSVFVSFSAVCFWLVRKKLRVRVFCNI